MLAGPLGKEKESSWLIRWECPGVRQRPHVRMRLSFPGTSGPGRMMLSWPPIPLRMPDPIGARLLERVPSSRRPSQDRASVFPIVPTTKQSQGGLGVQGLPVWEYACWCSNMQSPLLPQLLCPAFIRGSEACLPAS